MWVNGQLYVSVQACEAISTLEPRENKIYLEKLKKTNVFLCNMTVRMFNMAYGKRNKKYVHDFIIYRNRERSKMMKPKVFILYYNVDCLYSDKFIIDHTKTWYCLFTKCNPDEKKYLQLVLWQQQLPESIYVIL